MFTLTAKQDEARRKIAALAGKKFDRPYVFRLRGCAGTGKTSTLKSVHEELGDFIAVAPTGKAALRISEATGIPAGTIHRWLYTPTKDARGELKLTKKKMEQYHVPDSRLIIVDESSMVDMQLWEDLFEVCQILQMNIVVVGDGFQLPPVTKGKDGEYFNLMDDAFLCDDGVDLTEVMRQALESPIIRASMLIRKGDVSEALWGIPRVLERELNEKCVETFNSGDGAVICHKNVTRHTFNANMRSAMFGPDAPLTAGEPLLVLKNNYKIEPNLFNGEIVTFNGWTAPPKDGVSVVNFYQKLQGTATIGLATVGEYKAETALAVEEIAGSPELEKLGADSIGNAAKGMYGKNTPFLSCNYGYTLTCHKSQGSEWKNVLVVVEPSVAVNSYLGRRWLYTACTRAKENLSVAFMTKQW
jgi:exodeoxyribonuclease-5